MLPLRRLKRIVRAALISGKNFYLDNLRGGSVRDFNLWSQAADRWPVLR